MIKFNPEKHYLGKVCKRNHVHLNDCSIRFHSNRCCIECVKLRYIKEMESIQIEQWLANKRRIYRKYRDKYLLKMRERYYSNLEENRRKSRERYHKNKLNN